MKRILLTTCLVAAGCAAEPVPYHSQQEIPRGPGLLSGEKGEFSMRWEASAAPAESAAPRDAAEEREYQEWRASKKRQESGTK